MTPEEQEEMTRLCKQIAVEKNPITFDQLVHQLLELLDRKHKRIHPEHGKITS